MKFKFTRLYVNKDGKNSSVIRECTSTTTDDVITYSSSPTGEYLKEYILRLREEIGKTLNLEMETPTQIIFTPIPRNGA